MRRLGIGNCFTEVDDIVIRVKHLGDDQRFVVDVALIKVNKE